LTPAILTAAQASSARSDPRQILEAAEADYEKEDYVEAKRLLESLLKRFPRNYAANELMGLVLTAQGQEATATAFFKTAAQANPSSVEARANLAANLAQVGQNAPAEEEFSQALRLDPKNYDLNHNFGEFCARLGQIRKAIPYLQAAQEINPTSYSNGYDLAVTEAQAGMLTEAENQIRALSQLHDTAELHGLLGSLYERRSDFIGAARELQQAAQMDPSEDNIFEWAAELIRHRTLDPALQVLREGVKKYPDSWRLQTALGVTLYMLGYNDLAVEALCRAADINPQDSQPYFFLAKILGASPAQAEQVSARFERYVQVQPRDPWARYYYALSLWRSARKETATTNLAKVEALLRSALELNPRFAEAHLQLGILQSEKGNYPEAVREYQHAIELAPALADAHYRLGQALVRMGDKERGDKELKTSIELHAREVAEDDQKSRQILKFIYTQPGEASLQR
jgi:tetratricopeptide (TPR) repeat protein